MCRFPAAAEQYCCHASVLLRNSGCRSRPPTTRRCTSHRPQAAGLEGVHWRRRHGESYVGKRKELIEALRAAGMPRV